MSTLNERLATVLSLPAASVALTEKVWDPLISAPFGAKGVKQGASGFESNRQRKVEPASFELN